MRRTWTRLAVLVTAVLMTIVGAANPASANVIPNTTKCQNIGAANSAGYVAVHCAAGWRGRTTDGDPTVSGLGQAMCRINGNAAYGRCAGITQRVSIRNLTLGEVGTAVTVTCGSYGGGACPASGPFQGFSGAIRGYCNHAYQAEVKTTIILPGGGTRQSPSLSSYFGFGC